MRGYLPADAAERTSNVVRNIFRSFFYKGASIVATLMLVPLSLHYLDKERYGIWVALSSFNAWLVNFDIGIGNGLRNRLTEALARDQLAEARKLVSTAYAAVGVFMVGLWLIFIVASPYIGWSAFFGVSSEMERELGQVSVIVISLFFAQMLLSLINPVLNACQQNSKTGFIVLAINVGSLLAVYILTISTHSSFLMFCVAQSLVSVITYVVFNWYYFAFTLAELAPSLADIDLSKLRSMMGLGVQFFIMQIAALVLYQTNAFLIIRWFGPAEVTDYSVSARYFNVVTMGFSIITAPLWSSFAHAYAQQDYTWIRAIIQRSVHLWMALQVVILVMILNADWIYIIWTGHFTDIPLSLSIANGVYVSLYAWNSIFIMFLNGTGQIRLQFLLTLLILALFFPLTYGMAVVLGAGVVGVVWANCLCLAVFSIQAPLQYLRSINRGAVPEAG